MAYPIIRIEPDCILSDEQLGSKDKFWFEHDDQRWLFKEARAIPTSNGDVITGEDWAEKVAAEIATCIGVNAAKVELAEFQGKRGSASLNFVPNRAIHLEHGNEILAGRGFGYDPHKQQKQSDHTLVNIFRALQLFPKPDDNRQMLEQLASYLVFDALIGNTDRHHENWGMFWRSIRTDDPADDWDQPNAVRVYAMAPTFDHASSLGRELLDEKRMRMLKEGRIESYVRKAKGGIYWHSSDHKGMSPLELVETAVCDSSFSRYFCPALNKLRSVPLIDIQAFLNKIPPNRISDCAREFASAMLSVAYNSLTGLLK